MVEHHFPVSLIPLSIDRHKDIACKDWHLNNKIIAELTEREAEGFVP